MKYFNGWASVGWKVTFLGSKYLVKRKQGGIYDCLKRLKLNIGISSFLSF